MTLRPGIGYPLTSSYPLFRRFLAARWTSMDIEVRIENLLDRTTSRAFQSARLPAESVLPAFHTHRGFSVYPFHATLTSAVTVCFAIYAIC